LENSAAASPGRPAGRATRVRPGDVDRHRAADRELGIGLGHGAARHHQQFVHVGPAGDDGLGAGNHDAVGAAFDDMHVGIRIGLGVRPLGAVALGIGHGDADGEVGVADVFVVGLGAGEVLGAVFGVDRRRALQDAGHGVARQIALGAAGVAADQADRLELLQQHRRSYAARAACGCNPCRRRQPLLASARRCPRAGRSRN
jgi:hypothetical protein